MRYIIAAIVITALAVIYATARAAEGETLGFDYYVLAMSWSPQFCENHHDSEECSKPRGFILHGLWPQYEDGGYPEHCNRGSAPDAVIDDIMDVMPNRHLAIHEWHTHGSCTGLEPADYFKAAKTIFNSIAIPETFTTMGDIMITNPEGVTNVFVAENAGLKADAIQVICEGNRLTEVRICVDKQGQSRACNEVHGACHAKHLVVASPSQN